MPLEGGLTPGGSPGWARVRGRALQALAVLAILTATIRTAGTELPRGWTTALFEGDEGLAEVLQNIILFVPLGLTLALGTTRALRLVAVGTLLSLSVEFAQQWIPGRDPSVGDLVFNTLGTAVGVLLTRTAPRWLLAPPTAAARLSLAAALAAALVWLGTGWLLEPLPPTSVTADLWTPNVHDHLGQYPGRVLGVTGRLGYDGEEPLRIVAVGRRVPGRLCPLLLVEDEMAAPAITLFGVDRDDVVLRRRSRALLLTLDQPDLRARGALRAVTPGDTFTVTARRAGRGYCLGRDGAESCGIGYTMGDGWKLIFYPEHFPPGAQHLLNALWIAGWTLAVGWWARRDRLTGAALALVTPTLLVGPGLVGLLATPVSELLGGVVGVGVGWWTSRWYRGLKPRLGEIGRP